MVEGRKIGRFIVEGVSFLTLMMLPLGIWLCEMKGISFRRGFFCDDETIRFPYKDSTVPGYALIVISVSCPVVLVLCEGIRARSCLKHPPNIKTCTLTLIKSSWFINLLKIIKWYLIGIFITLILTESGKMIVGRLRPHFLDVCKPNFTLLNCSDSRESPLYVSNYQCFGDSNLISDARLSWPSGHSSLTAYVSVFLIVYLWSLNILPIFRALLTLFSFLVTLFTGLSRVLDNKHHPTDVLSGWIIGVLVASGISYSFISRWLDLKRKPKRYTRYTSDDEDESTAIEQLT